MATIYLLKYNNYYNRQLKHITPSGSYLTYSDLVAAGATTLGTFTNINFKWGDGVSQEIVLNYDSEEYNSPDYCLISDGVNKDITSVWFILYSSRIRNGQFRFSLYRDLVNTYFDSIITSPCFIEKATLPNDNPLIFNSENMTYNQIKKAEHYICDKTATPWIVGYFAENTPLTTGSFSLVPESNIEISGNHTAWEYYTYTENDLLDLQYVNSVEYNSSFYYSVGSSTINYRNKIGRVIDSKAQIAATTANSGFFISNASTSTQYDTYTSGITNSSSSVDFNEIESLLYSSYDNSDLDDLINNFNGKVINFDDGVYKVNVTKISSQYDDITDDTKDSVLYVRNRVKAIIEHNGGSVTINNNTVDINALVYIYRITMNKVAQYSGTYNYSLSNSARVLSDAPYKMFAIPYPANLNGCYLLNESGSSAVTSKAITKDLSLRWASNIAKQLGTFLYDIQIVPFCPLVNDIMGSYAPTPNVSRFTTPVDADEGTDFMYLYDNTTSTPEIRNVCFFLKASSFSFSTRYFELESGTTLKTVESSIPLDDNIKVQSETQLCRLCSPNFNGQFEFNVAKNGGLHYFNIDCTYKPYTPYIQVQPDFGGLYGKDFNDARGLILNGDFSIPVVSDQWVEYEIQNKNYQQTFNRQIENLEVNNSIARQEAGWSIVAGTVQGGVAGATAGAMAGGGWGAVAGGVIGTGTALGGGILDYTNLIKQQKETLDYTKDLYGYQLGNIQALPHNLTKVSSLNAISKYFPFLEVYECTDEEKTALENKLKYNGMTVNVIGTIGDYILNTESYIKGKLIRLGDLDIDYHEAIAIAEEINKGVFI